MKQTVFIKGMECKHCASNVKNALMDIDGVQNVEVSFDDGIAVITSNDGVDKKIIYDVLLAWGYEVTEVE